MATVKRIVIYPIKGFDPCVVDEVAVTNGGGLKGDRALAFMRADGSWLNGKTEPRIHQLRTAWGGSGQCAEIKGMGQYVLSHRADRVRLGADLSQYFGYALQPRWHLERGYPDNLNDSGPTLCAQSSLNAVSDWFPTVDISTLDWRFRVNLIIGDVDAFWEDVLVQSSGPVELHIGAVTASGLSHCRRCNVPPRDPQTGVKECRFQKIFSQRRLDTLPTWSDAALFDHGFYFTVTVSLFPQQGGTLIRLGDTVGLKT